MAAIDAARGFTSPVRDALPRSLASPARGLVLQDLPTSNAELASRAPKTPRKLTPKPSQRKRVSPEDTPVSEGLEDDLDFDIVLANATPPRPLYRSPPKSVHGALDRRPSSARRA